MLVRTAAAGLNFIETYQRSGVYAIDLPFTPGTEGSGEVVALGEGVDAALLGARVATATATGAYAEHFTAPADRLLAVPEGIDLAEAAALPLQGMTAHYLCRSTFPVEEGHTVVVTAGAGGVGLLLTQLATARGARVVTTASTEEKRELSRGAGAVAAVDYPDLAATVAELTDGEGAHAVFDGVGKDTFDTSLEVLRVRGTLVLFGGASGQVPPSTCSGSTRPARCTSPGPRWCTTRARARRPAGVVERCSGRGPPASSTYGSASASRWRTRPPRTPHSSPGRRRARCCSPCPEPDPPGAFQAPRAAAGGA